ncbi:MAG: ABC transporter ATP-binding protein [Proteobacteria bacterium]|nr:ABC transporter ATP-binding protein [Pseudomonadota bacterium]MBU1060378.1 ABC transporter ATP-binding protein [Pseudomonadota bacterium]
MKVYSIHKLNKSCNGRSILDIDHLELEAGRIYGLLGPNGAGKTTLLNILGFLDQPTSGRLEFLGKAVRFQEKELLPLRKEIVVLDQYPVLFTTSVYKNLEFGLKLRKVAKAERERLIDEVLDLVDMASFKHAPAYNLSGGETQRIALARALALSPKVFLCDEPTASVDVENQAVIVALLKQINENKNITIVFTTHDRLLAAGLAHHTLVLNEGRFVSTSYENTFSCRIEPKEDKQIWCRISEDRGIFLSSPKVESPALKSRLFIDSQKIDLHTGQTMPGVTNCLPGKVVQLMEESGRIRVVVMVGFLLTVILTREKYDSLRPAIGDTVVVSIPQDAVTLSN